MTHQHQHLTHIIAGDNFAQIVDAVSEGCTIWNNCCTFILVNFPVNNSQGMSVILILVFSLKSNSLTSIQDL